MKNGRANPQSSGGIVRSDIVGDGSQVLRSTRRKSKLHRSKRRNAASTSSSVANWPRLAFQDCGKMGGINCFRLSLVTCQGKHGMCYFVLAAGGQPAHRLKCFIQELGHSQ
jgi:hypothetical protein